MEVIQRQSGVEVSIAGDYQLSAERTGAPPPRRGGRPVRGRAGKTTDKLIVDALLAADEGMSLVDEIVLRPTKEATGASGRRGHHASPIAPRQNVGIQLDLEENAEGIVLLEQDGMFTWHFPGSWDASPARRGARRTGARRVSFEIEIYAESTAQRRRSRRGFIKNLIYTTVRAYVLKFVAKKAADGIVRLAEKKLNTGLVDMPTSNPASWIPLVERGGPLDLRSSGEEPANLLLMVHGTFSSTLTCFGALGASSWGKDFLDASNARYDAVLGFDHATLSVSPDKNADVLYQQLRQLADGRPFNLDIVTHSRGGLVFRSLVEQILPGLMWQPQIGRAVFVGVPNAGTTLAEPENWHAFVDLYTNLAMAMCKALSVWPQATFVTKIAEEAIGIIGDLVKYMATEAVTRRRIPGLSSMQPEGSFIKTLNRVQSGQPAPSNRSYYAITSSFDVELLQGLGEDDEPILKQLPRHLLMVAIDNIASRLLGRACDLVVNTDSMCQIDRHAAGFLNDVYDFGVNPHVYHTVYFTRPEVTSSLSKWLGYPTAITPAKRRGARNASSAIRSVEELAALDV